MLTSLTSGLHFPEGPVAMDDGSVVLVEMFGPRVTRVRSDGSKHTIATLAGGPNGAAIGPDGALYVCNNGGCYAKRKLGSRLVTAPLDPARYIGGRIQRVDLATGRVDDLYTECNGQALHAPNDLVFDSHGGFYFSDHGIHSGQHHDTWSALARLARRIAFRDYRVPDRDLTAIYYAKADGSRIEPVAYSTHAPNGVGLSPDGTKLYWSETFHGRVFRRTIVAPGKLLAGEANEVLCALPGAQMLDSMALEASGNLCVATLVRGGITVLAPESGKIVSHIATGDFATSNICFGGPQLSTAFITLSSRGELVRMAWPRPGLKLNCTG